MRACTVLYWVPRTRFSFSNLHSFDCNSFGLLYNIVWKPCRKLTSAELLTVPLTTSWCSVRWLAFKLSIGCPFFDFFLCWKVIPYVCSFLQAVPLNNFQPEPIFSVRDREESFIEINVDKKKKYLNFDSEAHEFTFS